MRRMQLLEIKINKENISKGLKGQKGLKNIVYKLQSSFPCTLTYCINHGKTDGAWELSDLSKYKFILDNFQLKCSTFKDN